MPCAKKMCPNVARSLGSPRTFVTTDSANYVKFLRPRVFFRELTVLCSAAVESLQLSLNDIIS